MDPLSALSIACNLMQVISFTGETIALCRTIYKRGSADPSLEGNAKTLSIFTKSLKISLESSDNQAPPTEAEQELRDLASKLLDKIGELRETLDQIGVANGQANIGKTIQAACRQLYKTGLLRRLNKEIQEYQKTLESGLLLKICNATEASALQNQQGFEKLDTTLQHFIISISKEQLQLSQLVQTLDKQIENGFLAIRDEATRSRVLKSLKYDGMNFRRSTVKEHHPQTFEWIFRDRQIKYDHELESLTEDFDSELDLEPDSDSVSTLSGPPSNSGRVDEDDTLDQTSDETSPSWDSFVKWLQTDDKTYWVSGKAGSGKSTLMLFLLRDARTHHHLSEWDPDTLVLSHFLLSSGHSLQRNTRGIYCSLLHQILADNCEHDGVLLSLVAARFPRILSKDVSDDWAEWELRDAILTALKHSKRAICIFIDGLDELVASEIEDGHLWSLLRGLERIANLKLCLSSRPEPIFRDHFEGAPKLQMQLLTDGDIRRYATQFLSANISSKKHQEQRHEVSRFINVISERANGVFLWVHLVLKRLRKGMRNKDPMVVLNRRLEEIPKELQDLFKDMWGRLGEDAKISEYLSLAARYFHLIRTAESRPVEIFAVGVYSHVTIAELMLATDRGILRDILEGNENRITAKRIQISCDMVVQNLDTCCAGLLEYREITQSLSSSSPNYENGEKLEYNNLRLDFVHRSARDFLFTTQEGANILSHDTSTSEDQLVLLCQARMTVARLCLSPTSTPLWKLIEEYLPSLSEDKTSPGVVLSQRRMQELVSLGGFLYSHPRLRDILLSPHNPPSESHQVDFMIALSATQLVGHVPRFIEMLNRAASPDYAGYLIIRICGNPANVLGWFADDQETKRKEAWLATVQYLINNRASLTLKGLALDPYRDPWAPGCSHVQLHSAAELLIQSLCLILSRLEYHQKLALVELMSTFVNRGADLATPIVVNILHQPRLLSYFLSIPMTTIREDDEHSIFFATTPGHLLRLVLASPMVLASPNTERQDLPEPQLGDLETAICGLLNHEAVSTAPPMLEALGVHSPTNPSAILQSDKSSPNERTGALLSDILTKMWAFGSFFDEYSSGVKIKDILSESGDVVSRVEFDEELARRKFFVSTEDFMKGMPRLGAEQEASFVERMRQEALEGLGELGKAVI